ncbi:amino acid ABC transporter ATP-binding protein [Microbacterium sp. ASV49]|uniref:Amino acid ABC transporter ATP-binding protein n=1 Tax=Microbacterium candidum TaxID=3041922 RepID=A0ABT7MV61_9MICO|nr:amino acid ABC transporter ATP-binding protein [Microbacterium sp. ASV49]MDL9978338.1 amino acid ABC transporter ATP-binding protein [Microbacterium sp. ASV49]
MTGTLVEARGLSKSYGDHEVLHGVDFTVRAGEVSCIIGPSGSGKSTFLRTINGLETVDGGSLIVDGEQVGYALEDGRYRPWRDRDFARFRARIGMVFQRFNLYAHLDAVENVAASLIHVKRVPKAEAHERAEFELARVGLADHVLKRPHQLSGGQQQRVAIARALAMDPDLMLFDEPTSALDPELVDEVLETMRALAGRGMTMIVVTHEIGFAREVADTLSFFDGGRVVEQGDPEQVLTDPANDRTRSFLERVR